MADRRYSDPIISERKNKGFQAIVQYTDSVVTSEGLYVMGSIDGRFMTPNYLSKRWRLLAEDLGLVGTQGERPTLHDLRHTMAMTAVHNGADIKIVSGLRVVQLPGHIRSDTDDILPRDGQVLHPVATHRQPPAGGRL